MSLVDPTKKPAQRTGAGSNLVLTVFVFACGFVATYLVASGMRQETQLSDLANMFHSWGGLAIGLLGFLTLVITGAAMPATAPGFWLPLAAQTLSMALGIWVGSGFDVNADMGFGRNDDGQVWELIRNFSIVGALALLFMLVRIARQAGKRARTQGLTPHRARIHDQGYTEATWEEYSASSGSVVLAFTDRHNRERYVPRKLTQYKKDPLPVGAEVQMFWDPRYPEDTSKMVFARDLGGRVVYF